MADKWPAANGNWSSAANWNGGTKPVAGDDVYADGKTVTIDENVTVANIRNTQRTGGTAGGSFTLNTGITVNANLTAGTVTLLNSGSAGSVNTINGNLTGGTANIQTVSHSNGTLTVNGNISGGTSGSALWVNGGTVTVVGNTSGGAGGRGTSVVGGTCSITGNCTGGTTNDTQYGLVVSGGTASLTGNITAGTNSTGADCNTTGTLNVTGSVSGSNITFNCRGLTSSSANPVTINGNVLGGVNNNSFGFQNSATGTVTINGSCIGGNVAGPGNVAGYQHQGNGTATITRAVGNDYGAGSSGITSAVGVANTTQASLVYVREIEYGSRGQSPTSGPIYFTNSLSNVAVVQRYGSTSKTLSDPSNVAGLIPATGDVRSGVVYGNGTATGTCAVPGAASVVSGTPVDNTVGTATITADSIRSALGMASANLDTQLSGIDTKASGIKAKTDQLTFTVANQVDSNSLTGGLTQAQVRSAVGLASANLDTQLAAIPSAATTSTAVWANATRTITGGTVDTLTNSPNVPSASAIASQVRTELTTELGRIDATISSRATPTTGVNPNPLTVTVQFSNAPVAGIAVSVLSGNSVIAWGRTNSSGQVVFGLAAGSYSIVAAASVYYQPPAAQSVSIPADTSKTITLTAQSIAAPVLPGLCTVRFAVVHQGAPVSGAVVTAEIDTLNSTVDSALVARTKTTGTTNNNGYVDLTLIRLDAFTFGGVYRFLVTDANGTKLYSRYATVPNVDSCFADDLVAVS